MRRLRVNPSGRRPAPPCGGRGQRTPHPDPPPQGGRVKTHPDPPPQGGREKPHPDPPPQGGREKIHPDPPPQARRAVRRLPRSGTSREISVAATPRSPAMSTRSTSTRWRLDCSASAAPSPTAFG